MRRILFAFVLLCGCGHKFDSVDSANVSAPVPDPLVLCMDTFVLKSRVSYDISTDTLNKMSVPPSKIPLTVVNTPNAMVSVDSSGLMVPALTPALLDFGRVQITALTDNDLKVCGKKDDHGNDAQKRCSRAVIRIYTTGAAAAGLYNAEDGYGLPITAVDQNSAPRTVGLGSADAAIVQTLDLGNKNTLKLSDFGKPLSYKINIDFSNAGAGTYNTTLVVEYGLID